MTRFASTILVGAVAAQLFAGTALAGGWATTEFDEPLPELTEGGSWLIGFTILQHGVHPAAVEGAGLRFTNGETGDVLFFEAAAAGAEGHYVASVARLSSGMWTLEVEQGWLLADATGAPEGLHFEPYPIGAIEVIGGDAVAMSETGRSLYVPVALAFTALAAGALVFVLIRRDGETVGEGVEYAASTTEEAV